MKFNYNKNEIIAMASQTSQNYDREGVLVLKERQEGLLFRRTEGYSVRWFRLRGNLLFYLKGPESWYEPIGMIMLGNHQIKVQPQDENGHWPFQIVWDNGVCFKMATFHESERTLWLKAIQLAPYATIQAQIAALEERLNKIRPVLDITTYRQEKGIVTDMNEVPLCELALSCDNLLCDAYGRAPAAMIVIFVKYENGMYIRYGATEVSGACSNPTFSRTILFRASDGLTGAACVRIVVYDVRERVSGSVVPMGHTSMLLSTIQEAQRLRVSLSAQDQKVVGFVTINGWSLEPSYIGTSPSHTNDSNSVDIPHKAHRRTLSLPPRLGLKLKFPSYGTLLKQNFVNSHQVTYRFHSGLGGDITVHEIMAEPKLCYLLPVQLLDIYIQREKELFEDLLSMTVSERWQYRQLDMACIHLSVLKHYCLARSCMRNKENVYFKASANKDEWRLEFAPTNLHLQRVWVHNDTLNNAGSHDVITVGAFAAHARPATAGGLIRLVQQVKDINSSKAELCSITNKIQAEYDTVVTMRQLRNELGSDADRLLMTLQATGASGVSGIIEGIKSKVKSILARWEPSSMAESLSVIGWPKNINGDTDQQIMSTILRLREQLSTLDDSPDYDTFGACSSVSSQDSTPTTSGPPLSSSVPNICNDIHTPTDLQFHNDYFQSDERASWNHSFRSVGSPKQRVGEVRGSFESKTRYGSLKYDFKSSSSLERVSYRSLVDSTTDKDRRKTTELPGDSVTLPVAEQPDNATREKNLVYLRGISAGVQETLSSITATVARLAERNGVDTEEDMEVLRDNLVCLKRGVHEACESASRAHAALRLRCESPQWAREHASLQTRRDTCFSQALATVTAGLLCWLSSAPADVIVKLLETGLGPLCGFEGLLSLHSTEKAMWGDMVVAIEDLHAVLFHLTKVGHSDTALPQVRGTRGALSVHIPVSDSLYAKFTSKEHMSFTITAVFFNVGVNEKARLAEALGETAPQHHSNCDNYDRLQKYYHKYTRTFPPDRAPPPRASSRIKPLEEVMENLRIVVHKKVPKNVEILHLASLATRLMHGVRFTSCKSAKDRTGMSVTLEQCSILAAEYHLAEHELQRALDIMRSEGCRRENTFKNISLMKYAFSKKQVMALPEEYRPPPGTYGTART